MKAVKIIIIGNDFEEEIVLRAVLKGKKVVFEDVQAKGLKAEIEKGLGKDKVKPEDGEEFLEELLKTYHGSRMRAVWDKGE
jgi:hypothetical protein